MTNQQNRNQTADDPPDNLGTTQPTKNLTAGDPPAKTRRRDEQSETVAWAKTVCRRDGTPMKMVTYMRARARGVGQQLAKVSGAAVS